MLRPRPLSRALAVIGIGLVLLGAAAPARATTGEDGGARATPAAGGARTAARTTPGTPLDPTIDRLSRAVIPKKGDIRIGGTVTNDDSVTWHNVRVYPFIGSTPMTTEAQVRQAATSDPTAFVGDRILQEDCSTACVAQVGDLAPGQTAAYSLVVARKDLPVSEPGVYWFGVHTLGETADQPFDLNADGRARTFLPLLPDRRQHGKHAKAPAPEPVSLILPIRQRVLYRPDGSIARVDDWATDLTTGRLGDLVSFGNTGDAVTWLVDPAVLDAVRRLAAGNPPRSLTARPAATGPSGGPSVSATPESSPSPSVAATTVTDADTQAAQQAAREWLAAFQTAVKGHEVLGLPYGDPDIAALAHHDPSLYRDARAQANTTFKQLGITDTPAVAPLSGYLDHASLRMIGHRVLTIVGDQMIAGHAPAVARVGRNVLHTTSAAAAAGGPLPGDPLSPIALRQRIVTEAALHLADGGRPLVVSLPEDWTAPSWDAAGFLGPFSQPWLSLQPLSSETAPARPVDPGRLRFPQSESDALVPPFVLDAVRSLVATGETLDSVLNHPGVSAEVLDEALTSTSYSARTGRGEAALRSEQYIATQLDGIRIEPPTAVTLSSDTGRFAVTVANTLPEPVTVQLKPVTDSGLDVRVPKDLSIPAGGSASVLLTAAARTNGVHFVTLQIADATGAQLGTGVRIPIRTAQVSRIIWLFVGVGLGLLFAAIAVRLVRRIRASRRAAT